MYFIPHKNEKRTKHMLLRPRFMAIQYLVLLQYNKIMEVLHRTRDTVWQSHPSLVTDFGRARRERVLIKAVIH